jgi:hypothetical protein
VAVLPALRLDGRSRLPAGRVEPHARDLGALPRLGGYRSLLVVGAIVWLLVLGALVLVGRRGRIEDGVAAQRPRTLAERLRPLVQAALAGDLSRAERSQLELSLVAFWRARLGLEDLDPEQAMHLLREHEKAGPLLRGLEQWLHAPTPPAGVDLAALLAPYRDLPADALEGRIVPAPSR